MGEQPIGPRRPGIDENQLSKNRLFSANLMSVGIAVGTKPCNRTPVNPVIAPPLIWSRTLSNSCGGSVVRRFGAPGRKLNDTGACGTPGRPENAKKWSNDRFSSINTNTCSILAMALVAAVGTAT